MCQRAEANLCTAYCSETLTHRRSQLNHITDYESLSGTQARFIYVSLLKFTLISRSLAHSEHTSSVDLDLVTDSLQFACCSHHNVCSTSQPLTTDNCFARRNCKSANKFSPLRWASHLPESSPVILQVPCMKVSSSEIVPV